MMLLWDVENNVPLLKGCSGEEVRVIRTSKWSDPSPATDFDLKLLKSVLEDQFGTGSYQKLLPNGDQVILMGKVPYLDLSYEIIADGVVLGHLFFDIFDFRWYFKPSRAGAERLRSYLDKINASGDKGTVIGEAKEDDPKFVLTKNGLAERQGNKYVQVKVFKPGPEPLEVPHDRKRMIKLNEYCLNSLMGKSILFIRRLAKKRRLILSFSGGKDSSTLLDLVSRSDVDFKVYFNDTGLELPETLKFVEKVGVDIVGDAGDSFWRYVGKFGPPARDYRWCCKVIKLAPTFRALKPFMPALTLVGQRKFESIARSKSPPIWRNPWMPGFLSASPINDWTALSVWLYAWSRGVELNPLYYQGFKRLGCYLCPAAKIADYLMVKERYPDLWDRWESFLRKYAGERGYSEEWVKLGLWRWIKPPKGFRRLGIYKRPPLTTLKIRENLALTGNFTSRVKELSITLGKPDDGKLNLEKGRLIFKENAVEFEGKALKELARIYVRVSSCTECGVCTTYCDALYLSEGIRVNAERCTSCGLCNEVCPLSYYSRATVGVVSSESP